MGRTKKGFLLSVVAFLFIFAGLTFPAAGAESKYPSRAVDLICPFAPGGTTDMWSRITADFLKKPLSEMKLIALTFHEVAEAFLSLQIFGDRDTLGELAYLEGLASECLVDRHEAGLDGQFGKLDGQGRVKTPADGARAMDLDVFWSFNR